MMSEIKDDLKKTVNDKEARADIMKPYTEFLKDAGLPDTEDNFRIFVLGMLSILRDEALKSNLPDIIEQVIHSIAPSARVRN